MGIITRQGKHGIGEIITLADPAVGAYNPNWEFEVPAGEVWEPLSLQYILTTNATVANRAMVISITDGTETYWRTGAGSTMMQTASTVIRYTHDTAAGNVERKAYGGVIGSGVQDLFCFELGKCRMLPGHKIQAFFVSFQINAGGDAFTDINLAVRKWSV